VNRKASIHANPEPLARHRRGHGRVTLEDVAQVAGVTSITVSRFLRAPEVVAPATAGRIRAALAETGYVPNKQAGQLASGRGNIVAAIIPSIANSIFAETVQGLSDALQAAGHELLLASTGYSLEREEEQLRAVLGWSPSALAVTGRRHSPGALAMLRAAQAAGMPIVELWDRHEDAEAPGFAQVGFDHAEVGAAMARHLLGLGHRRLAYIDSGVAEDFRAHERGAGFAAAARAARAQVRVLQAAPGDAFDAGRAALDALLAEGDSTAAAFANDHLASGALLEAAARGIAVPQRLAVLGFGDFPIGRQLVPPLSTVKPPRYEIGREAGALLIDALQQRAPLGHRALPWTLIPRASTTG
jgi:LacI family gluconate utilization system Gnt-I transcriptional repressor